MSGRKNSIPLERGTGNLKEVDRRLEARGYTHGLGPAARRLLKKVRTRKRRHVQGDEVPSV